MEILLIVMAVVLYFSLENDRNASGPGSSCDLLANLQERRLRASVDKEFHAFLLQARNDYVKDRSSFTEPERPAKFIDRDHFLSYQDQAFKPERDMDQKIDRYLATIPLPEDVVLPKLVPATAGDYRRWLKAHINAGGKVTHDYSYEFPEHRFWVAKSSFNMLPMFGADSFDIIVPEQFSVTVGGHSNAFYMKDGSISDRIIPSYTNTNWWKK